MMPGNTLQKTPREYFRDHFYVCYWFETVGPTKLMEEVGRDNILFETDTLNDMGLVGTTGNLTAAINHW